MNNAIRMKVFKKFFLGVSVILAFLVGGIVCLLRIQYNNTYTATMRSKAQSVASSLSFAVKGRLDEPSLAGELSGLLDEIEGMRIGVYRHDRGEFICVFDYCSVGNDVNTSCIETGKRFKAPPYVENAFESAQPFLLRETHEVNILGNSVTCCAPVIENDGASAVVRVDIAMSKEFVGAEKYNLYYLLVFTLLALSMLLYCMYVSRMVIRPLSKIQSTAESIAMHDELFDASGENDMIEAISLAIERIRDKQEKLNESLSYASEIQVRMLTSEQEFAEAFKDYGIYWKPLALVSGDFYWLRRFPSGTVLICGDCTGHGIPGALMTMMIISLLESIVNERNCSDTRYVLWKLDEQLGIILNRSRSGERSTIKDGLDAVIIFTDKNRNLTVSSTNMKLFRVKPLNTVEVVNGQRFFIGDGKITSLKSVHEVRLRYEEKVCYFMASDGLFEQVGGERSVPYGYSRFKKLIHRESAYGMQQCVDAVKRDLTEYMADTMQRDDVTIIGFRP